ncbi:hypothetical protein D9M68_668910 [compost metagenome]
MLIYNVTIILEEDIADEWLTWMKDIHIPEVMATHKFTSSRLLKVVDSPNEGITYCAQYMAASLADYEAYQTDFAPALQAKTLARFENKFVAFRSLMQLVD